MRRLLFILFFILVTAGVVWYAASSVEIPEYTFQQAAGVGDSKKKVIVTGKVIDKDVTADGGLTFYMVDGRGEESKIFYDGQDPVTVEQINAAKQSGRNVSVAGHTCGDRFHTSGITIH